ncbi:hypothetical protein B296_00017726 [Ensete ventricosum]|uniref:Transposase (putative) gypsy type domain-containing protein n=1 Tax=Ensete ventricosum TaxID=4639 RepID=A0A427B4M6_ENSVE|nr:hypothetical protein B296_00017726 [Ensete ventricosum]
MSLGDLVEKVNSGTNPGDLAERVNSGTSFGDLAERVNSGTNPGDLAEKVNSGTNPGDLAEKVNSGINPRDLAERVHTYFVSWGDPEASSSGASSGPPSPVDARVLRDLEVMKADHYLDMTMTEGSLAVIRGRYSIPVEYGLHVPQPEQRPYSSDAPDMCITVDAMEADLRFPLHPLIEECLRWWRISPSQVAPNSWRYLVVFLGECRGAGIILTRDLFMTCFRLCKSRGGYYLTARVGFRVSGAPSNNKGWKSHYLFVSGLVWGFRLDWSGHPIGNAPPFLSEAEFVLVGRLKGILSSSCAIKEMTELWLVKAGLGLASRDRMYLGDLRGMPKISGGKAPSTLAAAQVREVGVSPAREAPKASSKRPIDAPTEQVDDLVRRHKKVKVLTGDRSISDQKNLDGLSLVKNAWMARDGWRFGIPWTCEVNRPTNWERGSSLPWTNPKREAVVSLGRALARKFNSNSFANRSNEDIEVGLRREYQVLAGPLSVVGKARHISASDMSYRAIWARNAAMCSVGSLLTS